MQIIEARILLLREQIKFHNLDGFLIPSNDEFQSEYVPEHLNRLKYITNFSGSNGAAVITGNAALFFTDGRYILQAQKELGDVFVIQDIAKLNQSLLGKIGYDPKLHTKNYIDNFKQGELIACKNLVDLIWHDQPKKNSSNIFTYPFKYAGELVESKKEKIRLYLEKENLDALIITDPASICWLLNIRAHDIAYNPILLSYLIFYRNGEIELFYDELEGFEQKLALLRNKIVQVDPASASLYIINQLNQIIFKEDPCLLMKACKNAIEVKQARRVHILDGAALCKLFYWLSKAQNISEMDVAEKLLQFRGEHKDFIYPSFPTIAGFKENGAIIHYNPTKESNKLIEGDGLLLLDSGGQYLGGTTDITRVIPIGKPSYQQKYDFTLVLKGHIAIAASKFPKGTAGSKLDSLARYYLWQNAKDYAHGTGHGVGSCLSVHEGPARISAYGNYPLHPGMILSNEPGYYKNGEYGIRIENLMLVKDSSGGFLQMETISLAPIDRRLILTKLLSSDEIKWLNNYHRQVYKKISPLLSDGEKIWLKKQTKELCPY